MTPRPLLALKFNDARPDFGTEIALLFGLLRHNGLSGMPAQHFSPASVGYAMSLAS